jgi:hypothetical protein
MSVTIQLHSVISRKNWILKLSVGTDIMKESLPSSFRVTD